MTARMGWALALGLAGQGAAAQQTVDAQASLELWGYGMAQQWVDGPLNPGNRYARLPERETTGEARLNLKVKTESVYLLLEPRLHWQHSANGFGATEHHETWLNQGYARIHLGDAVVATLGRERLTWGPAQWRSPSSPWYFDAGRARPLAEVSGVGLARMAYRSGAWGATLAHAFDDGQAGSVVARDASLLKIDHQGASWLASAIAARQADGAPFVGGFAQATLGDAWLVYAEVGYGAQPGAGARPASRGTTALLGASYTLDNGQSLIAEWLRNTHAAPGRRDTLSAVWQSSLQDGALYWRAALAANARDGSAQATLLVEKNLSPRWSLFALAVVQRGGVASEFASYVRQSLTLGAKGFVF